MVASNSTLGRQGVEQGDLAFAESRQPRIHWLDLTPANSSKVRIWVKKSQKHVYPNLHGPSLLLEGAAVDLEHFAPRCEDTIRILKKESFLLRTVLVLAECSFPFKEPVEGFNDPFGFRFVMSYFGASWQHGWFSIAALSFMTALFNVLPVVPLDGGRAVLALLAIAGRPVSHRLVAWLSVIGSYLVIGYMLYAVVRSVMGK